MSVLPSQSHKLFWSNVQNKLFSAPASVYTLDNDSKKWNGTGIKGRLSIYLNNIDSNNIMIEWLKPTDPVNTAINWILADCKLQPKGERAWVITVVSLPDNTPQTIALRFSSIDDSNTFSKTYTTITSVSPLQLQLQLPLQINELPSNKRQCKFKHENNVTCLVCAGHKLQPLNNPIATTTSGWKCKMCSYVNDSIKVMGSTCAMCYSLPNVMGIRNTQQNSTQHVSDWCCAVCTYVNNTDSNACVMCGLSFIASVQAADNSHNINAFSYSSTIPNSNSNNDIFNQQHYWICASCNMQNSQCKTKCESCQTSKTTKTTNIKVIYDENGNISTTEFELKSVACYIATKCGDPADVFHLFFTLISVIDKLAVKTNVAYQTLDTTNPKVMERLIVFEGVVEFLALIGFESDAVGQKLHCKQKPHINVLRDAINALIFYQTRFGVGKITVDENTAKHAKFNEKLLKIDEIVVSGYIRKYNCNVSIAYDLIQLCTEFYFAKIITLRNVTTKANYNGVGSIEQLLHYSVQYNDSNYVMETIISGHKMFIDTHVLVTKLRRMFLQHILADKTDEIRLNILYAIQMWMKMYWKDDFINDDAAKKELQLWFHEELLCDEFRTKYSIKSDKMIQLICSISNEFDALKSLQLNAITQLELISWVDQKQKHKDILLVSGYIRNERLVPIQLTEMFLRFYPRNIEINASKMKKYVNNWSAQDLANQMTLIDKFIFDRIEDRELWQHNWKKEDKEKLSPHVLLLIRQYNNFSLFVQMEILKQKNIKMRVKTMRKMLKLCQRLMELRNYNSLSAVLSALNSSPIHRLKHAWKRVPDKDKEMLEFVRAIYCRDNEHRKLRQLVRSAAHPCVPNIGLMLQDLVLVDESSSSMMWGLQIHMHGIVNFDKLARIKEIIQEIKSYQTCNDKTNSYDNIIEEDLMLQKIFLMEFEKLKDVTEDQVWDISTEIKKQDSKLYDLLF